jgi:uncharacterized membrane protein
MNYRQKCKPGFKNIAFDIAYTEIYETTETDDSGNFSLRLAAGTYQVTVSADGFVSQTVKVVVDKGGYKTINFSMAGA